MIDSIRELKRLQGEALARYHAEYQALEDRIKAVRKERGTKLKEPDWTGYYEEGRSDPELRTPRGYRG